MNEAKEVQDEARSPSVSYPAGTSHHVVDSQMFFFGVACVLFWSVFLIQLPYAKEFFGGADILFYVPMVYGLSSNISRVFVMYKHSRSTRSTGDKLRELMMVGASVTAIGMCLLSVLMMCVGRNHPLTGCILCLVITGIVGAFNSLLVTGGFALMSIVPKGSGQFFLLGMTATGIITWPFIMILRLLVSACYPSSDNALLVSVISLVLSGVLCASSILVYWYYTMRHELLKPRLNNSIDEASGSSLREVWRKICTPAIAMWCARVVTFALYPGMIGLMSPSSSKFMISDYQSFLIYMGPLSDTIGQLVYRFTPVGRYIRMRGMVWLTAIRSVVIIPLFLLSVYYNGTDSLVAQDWFRGLLMFGFSCSMGINYSAGNAIAPELLASSTEKYLAGVILSFVAMNGLFVGSLVGVGFKQIFTV
jgi:hypothetical protein